MEDDLRAVMDDDAPVRRYASHQRNDNWLAYQIALGIVIGGLTLAAISTGLSILVFGVLLDGLGHAMGSIRLR